MSGGCDICCGTGEYPIINRYGSTKYAIRCPECLGSGLSDEEAEIAARRSFDRARYNAVMWRQRKQESGE